MIELIIGLGLVAALIYAWWTNGKKLSFDDIVELRFLPSRRHPRHDLEEIRKMVSGQRGVCQYKGMVSPWTNKPCECKGYVFKRYRRGTQYCECGDQWIVHRFKMEKKDDDETK